MRENRLLVGAAYMILASAAFAAMGVCIKIASQDINNEMIVFLRNVFGLLFLAPWLWHRGVSIKTQRFGMHLFRSVVGLSAMYCFFYTIPRLNLAEAVLLNYSIPLFTPLIAWLFMKEKTDKITGLAILVGFVGIIFILQPGTPKWSIASLTGVGSGVLAAIALTSIRVMSNTEPPGRIVFWFAVISIAISAIPAYLSWQPLSNQLWGLMVVLGLFATCGQLLISKGFQQANAPQVSLFTYSAPVWAGLFAAILWQEQPDQWSILGMIVVAMAGIAVTIHSEVQKHRDRKAEAAAGI